MDKFEVNKKYKHKQDDSVVYTCVFATSKGGLLTYKDREEDFWYFEDRPDVYKEYRPPVVHKRWVHFYRYPNNIVCTIADESSTPEPSLGVYLGSIPVEFTEKDD